MAIVNFISPYLNLTETIDNKILSIIILSFLSFSYDLPFQIVVFTLQIILCFLVEVVYLKVASNYLLFGCLKLVEDQFFQHSSKLDIKWKVRFFEFDDFFVLRYLSRKL
jgi:hypothetical protein